MEKIGWTYISAIASITLGWFLNELGQWFRTRKEDKKIIKKVLYNLLETHFTFNQLNTSEITQLLTDRLIIRIPDQKQKEEVKQYLSKLYPLMIRGFIQDDVADRLEKIEVEYTKAVDNLATVDPITAYRLNGKTRIIQSFDLLQEYFEEIKSQFPEERKQIQYQLESTIESIKPKIINEAIFDIEKEINKISYSINIWTWIKAKKTLNRTKGKIKKDGEIKIDELLDKFLPK